MWQPLGGCAVFLVVDPLSRKLIEVIRNPYRGQQANPQIVYLIAGKGEEAIIVGSIDQQSYDMFMQFGIRVFGGYQGPGRQGDHFIPAGQDFPGGSGGRCPLRNLPWQDKRPRQAVSPAAFGRGHVILSVRSADGRRAARWACARCVLIVKYRCSGRIQGQQAAGAGWGAAGYDGQWHGKSILSAPLKAGRDNAQREYGGWLWYAGYE